MSGVEPAAGAAYARELAVVLDAVGEAEVLLRAEARRPGGPRGRRDHAPVDDEIGDLLCARLQAAFPDDGIRCEDGGIADRRGPSGRAFVIDPHDGTSDFLKGRRETSISVALVADGRLVLGVVALPCAAELAGRAPDLAQLLGEPAEWRLSWAAGEAPRLNGRPLAAPPALAALAPGSVILASRFRDSLEWQRRRLAPARVLPCASIATRLALAAAGRVAVGLTMWNRLADWDFAGGQAILQGAGGDVVDEHGAPIPWHRDRCLGQRRDAYVGARCVALAQAVVERLRSA